MKKPAQSMESSTIELRELNIIRTATALTRYPIHRLTKHGETSIEFKATDEEGQLTLQWQVSHNAQYGQPGPLAYQLDTLIVNRRIEKAGYPLPDLIKLGSFRDICHELEIDDGGSNTTAVRNALYQNAFAAIVAQVRYTGRDKSKRLFEFGTTRYGLILAGEDLPSGSKADAVYIMLNPIYRELLNKSELRPLDYEYLKALKRPIAQRFYELLSFQIYGALQSRRTRRAKYLYSEFCQQAPQQRYFQFKRMHMQMRQVHAPHLASGYILEPVEFRETTDSEGQIDWEMLYTPGPRARSEHRLVSGRLRVQADEPERPEPLQLAFPSAAPPAPSPLAATAAPPVDGAAEVDPATEELIALLVDADLNRGDAERFALERPEVCRKQLEYLPLVREFKSSRGAYLRRAIEGDFGAPAAYTLQQAREKAKAASATHQEQEQAEKRREKARKGHQKRFYGAFEQYLRKCMAQASKAQPRASTAFVAQETAQRSTYTSGPLAGRPLTEKALEVFDREESRLERGRLFWCAQGVAVLSFWQWDEKLNPESFRP